MWTIILNFYIKYSQREQMIKKFKFYRNLEKYWKFKRRKRIFYFSIFVQLIQMNTFL